MANYRDIITGLRVPSQIPLDVKTHKYTLAEIETVSVEQAITYYAGMRVDIAENNKQYVWKEVLVGSEEQPTSNTYTYPSNYVIDGYTYSNKTFAFYEIVVSSDTPTPQPDDRIIYRTETPYLPMPGLQEYRTNWQYPLEPKEVDVNSTPQNYKNETFKQRPIASTTLKIFRAAESIFDPKTINPLWIEYYPNSRGEVEVVVGTEDLILEAIQDPTKDTIVIKPEITDEGPVIKFPTIPFPIDRNIDIIVPWKGDVIVKGPVTNAPIFSSGTGKIKFDLDSLTRLDFKNTKLAEGTAIQVVGGTIKANDLTSAFIKGNKDVSFKDVNLEFVNSTIVEATGSSKLTLDGGKLVSQSEILPVFKVADNNVTRFKNSNFSLSGSLSSLMLNEGGSDTEFEGINIEGNVNKVFAVSQGTESFSPAIAVNNSKLDKLVTTALFAGITHNEGVIAHKLKVNNTLLLNDEVLTNSVEGIKSTNSVVDGTIPDAPSGIPDAPSNGNTFARRNGAWVEISPGTGGDVSKQYVDNADEALSQRIDDLDAMLPVDLSDYVQRSELEALQGRVEVLEGQIDVGLQRFPSRVVARDNGIGNNQMFINTNNNHEDELTWFLDVVIL